MLGNNFSQDASAYLPHWWLATLAQGLNLILASFAFSISYPFLGAMFVRFWSVLLTIYAAFVCCSSLVHIVSEKTITVKASKKAKGKATITAKAGSKTGTAKLTVKAAKKKK
jgi:hypothetical protein